MKKRQFIINLFVYLLVILGMLFLYFPFNNALANHSASLVQFIYAQF